MEKKSRNNTRRREGRSHASRLTINIPKGTLTAAMSVIAVLRGLGVALSIVGFPALDGLNATGEVQLPDYMIPGLPVLRGSPV